MDIYFGLDLGCTGCKAVAADENGRVLATASERYDDTLVYKGGGAYDQEASVLRDFGLAMPETLDKYDR